MNNFQAEAPPEQRERLRPQRDQPPHPQQPPLRKRAGEGLERDRRRPSVLERERAASLSERILERERMARLAAEREREPRGGAERRFDPVSGIPRVDFPAALPSLPIDSGASPAMDRKFDGGLDKRIGLVDDRESGRAGIRPLVSSSFGRARSGEREREESREKIRVKVRQNEVADDEEEDDDVLERESQKENSPDPVQELVAQYKTALSELTFNSKPIITNLTIIAGEHVQEAKAIAETVCAHILEVPIDQKLPSLYLLDSIVKNIAGEYIKHFASNLCEVFCTAYRDVDPSIHSAMQHLFRTWRGIFPVSPLRMIEKELNFPPMLNGPSSSNNPAKHADSLSQRPGHSIHVNPKYIQAQRHRLQQSSRPESLPSESNGEASTRDREVETPEGVGLDSPKSWPDTTKRPVSSRTRNDSFTSDPGYNQKILSKISDYDYSSSNLRADAGKDRMIDRDEPWDRTWMRESEDAFKNLETASVHASERASGLLRFTQRDEYESRQLSARTLVDTYGSVSGPRTSRMTTLQAQPIVDLDMTGERSRNWRNSEVDEYVWESTSPRLLDHTRVHDIVRKDEWLSTDIDKGTKSIASGRVNPSIQEQPASDHFSWSRHESLPLAERTLPSEGRLLSRKELNERNSILELQQDILDSSLDSPLSGSKLLYPLGHGSNSKLQPRSSSQQLSPPAQSRSRPLQISMLNRNLQPTDRNHLGSFSHTVNLSLPPPSITTAIGNSTGVRGSTRLGTGSFASGLGSFGPLSPVTPVASFLSQNRQSQKPSSPPLSFISQNRPSHRPPSPPLLQARSQTNSSLLPSNLHSLAQTNFQHTGHTRPLGQFSGITQSQLSQQPSLPLLQQHHPQAVAQLRPPLQPVQPVQQVLSQEATLQQPMARSQSNSEPQIPSQQQSSQATAKQPSLAPNLLQSLQQLQSHLQPFSATAVQPSSSQPQQQMPVAPPMQQSQLVSQGQLPQQQHFHLQHMPPQQSGVQSANHLQTANFDSQSQQSRSSSNGLLAALLQSGIMPSSQASLMLSHSRPLSPKVSSGLNEDSAPQHSSLLHPPLPSGPPPFQFSNPNSTLPSAIQSSLSLPVVTSIMTSPPVLVSVKPTPVPPIPALANLPTAVSLPVQMAQPPLPPGPPPVSFQVPIPTTLPSVSVGGMPPMNNFSSLLSSLVAQGIISAPAAKPVSGQEIAIGDSVASPSDSNLISLTTGNPSASSVGSLAATLSTFSTAFKLQVPSAPSSGTILDKVILNHLVGTEFKQEILRERHDAVINALYSDIPRQCKTCGLRFKVQEEHSKHMDWHVARNRRQKSQKKVSRKWFVSVKEWLSGTGASESDMAPPFFPEAVVAKPEKHEVAVPADENQSACALCGEPFEDFYSDETEEWMYKGAVYMNIPAGDSTEGLDSSVLGPIVHAKCRSESAATPVVDSAEDDES